MIDFLSDFYWCHVLPQLRAAGTAFFGGPQEPSPFQGLQAEFTRIPFANAGLVKLPDGVSDDQAIRLSDILLTPYFGAKLAEVTPDETVVVFGCGPEAVYKTYVPGQEHPTKEQARGSFELTTELPIPWVEPQDISNAVLFLISEEARYITGVALPIDAGATASAVTGMPPQR